MTGQKPDEKIREPFVWDGTKEVPTADWEGWTYNTKTASYQTQVKDPASIWNLYRDLNAFRKDHSDLKSGSIENVDLGTNRILAFTRSDATETLMVVHNLSKDAQEVTLTQDTSLVFNQSENTLKDKALHLEPYGSVILQVKER